MKFKYAEFEFVVKQSGLTFESLGISGKEKILKYRLDVRNKIIAIEEGIGEYEDEEYIGITVFLENGLVSPFLKVSFEDFKRITNEYNKKNIKSK